MTGFIQSARLVCREIERIDLHDTQPLLSALIQLLHESNNLTHCSIKTDDDLEAGSVSLVFLDRVPDDVMFQVVFDPLDSESVCTLSLKDALGDIYESLKFGLEVLDNEPETKMKVLWQWKLDYETHWGRHLIDVIRFLFLCPSNILPI